MLKAAVQGFVRGVSSHTPFKQAVAQPSLCVRGLATSAALEPDHLEQYKAIFELPKLRGVLIDAAGTLLSPSEPAAAVYLRYGQKYGVNISEREILQRFRRAYNAPWGGSSNRYVGDGRPFWKFIVSESVGNANPKLFEELYDYYARPEAWIVTDGAVQALQQMKANGLKLAVVSNFDTRLRPLLRDLGLAKFFDAIIISAEVGVEKPNPVIFEEACEQLGVLPSEAVHIGDDRRNDVYGARDAGCYAWLWGLDVRNFDEVVQRILLRQCPYDDVW